MQQNIRVPADNGDVNVEYLDVKYPNMATHEVIVSMGQNQSVKESNPIKLSSAVHPDSSRIYDFYRNVHRGNFVPRSGFGACGGYGHGYTPSSAPNYHRIESDTEHANGCMALLSGLQKFYPHLLSHEDFHQAGELLQLHDIGENDNGDVMDDGSRKHAERDYAELLSFAASIAHLPCGIRESLIKDFIYFQNPLDSNIPSNAIQRIQTARSIDKLEAILSGAFYEAHGTKPTLQYKDEHFGLLTERDRRSIVETEGDTSIVATWLVQVVIHYHACYSFPYVFDVVKAAIIDLRGEWFPWFDNFCTRHQIPPQHVNHPGLIDDQLTISECFYKTTR